MNDPLLLFLFQLMLVSSRRRVALLGWRASIRREWTTIVRTPAMCEVLAGEDGSSASIDLIHAADVPVLVANKGFVEMVWLQDRRLQALLVLWDAIAKVGETKLLLLLLRSLAVTREISTCRCTTPYLAASAAANRPKRASAIVFSKAIECVQLVYEVRDAGTDKELQLDGINARKSASSSIDLKGPTR